jgi:hypothetical protein
MVLQIQSFKGDSNFIINLAKNHFHCCCLLSLTIGKKLLKDGVIGLEYGVCIFKI